MLWVSETLGEICKKGRGRIQTGPFGSQLHESDYSSDGTPVVMPADIVDGKIAITRIARVPETHVERLKRHKLSKGDIVYGRRGDIGRQALVRDENIGWLCGTGCLKISLGTSSLTHEFLHRYLSIGSVVGWIEGQAVGATMPNLNTGILERISICYPADKAIQKKIATILGAYDDLIENNRRRIALLEKMAEEIYREWFVRMRFPGYEKVKIIKGVPEAWEIQKIGQLFNTSSGGTPSRENASNYEGDICWAKTGELKSTFVLDTEEKITQQGLENSAAKIYPRHTIVIAMYCAMPDISILAVDSATNQACCAFFPKKDYLHYTYSYLLIKFAQNHLINFAHGAAQQNLSQELIKGFPLLKPTQDLIIAFSKIAEPIFTQVEQLMKANTRLQKTQAALLPRLISGKLSVEHLNIQFPPSMAEELKTEAAHA